jgi:hypothetical protein
MTLVFWVAEDILFIDYLEKRKTIAEKICEKRPGLPKYLSLGQCTCPQSFLAMEKLRDLHYKLLKHPPCSAYLDLSDFSLFPNTLFLAAEHFSSNQETIAAVEVYFADLTKNHYRDRIIFLEQHRWNKCVSIKGDYVTKKNILKF